ncbi:radical SAM protein [Caulobacter sp. S45]|uniref:radical SAM protein n=1 Tax=Caulobacter sp. S45 TaxID=1641861 RepID=UPI00131BA297|nr:radical SAM protein [Caulobacter sp. S45]
MKRPAHPRLRALNERLFPDRLLFGPTHIVLGVNNFCNLHCVMCDVGTGNSETNFGANLVGAKTRSMPIELFRHVVDEMAAFCPTAHLGFAFTEPLAWRPIGEALAMARERGLQSSVTTNGLLLTRHLEDLAHGQCRNLAVSLDGPEAVHDQIRRHSGSYARAVAGIEALAMKPGAPDISVYCTITELNVGSLRPFLREMSRLPLKRVGLLHNNFVTADQAERHNAQYAHALHATASNVFLTDPGKIELELLAEELQEIEREVYPFPVLIQPGLTSVAALETYYRRPEVPVGRTCHDASRILMIDPDGEAIPVHGRCFRFPIGNIRQQSLASIWNHEHLGELRRTLRQAGGLLPACSRCCSGFGGVPRQAL